MEKIKKFIIKYQLWFKLAAIALLICVVFTPYIYIIGFKQIINKQAALSFWHIVFNNRCDLKDKTFLTPNSYNEFPAYTVLGWCAFLLTLITITFIIISIFKKKFFLIASLSYFINFIMLLVSLIYSIYAYKNSVLFTDHMKCVPNIAFYLSLLLCVVNIFVLKVIYIPKKIDTKTHKSIKEERIAELEKRIEELEQERDGK